jgi:hypothetical protein
MELLPLRPSIKHPYLWFPNRHEGAKWDATRLRVLTRDKSMRRFCGHYSEKYMQMRHLNKGDDDRINNLVTCCVACHAVQHFGRNLQLHIIEIWKSPFSQLQIVQMSREAIRAGKTLKSIKKSLKLTKGPYVPTSFNYANKIIKIDSMSPTFYLHDSLRVVFVALKRWRID